MPPFEGVMTVKCSPDAFYSEVSDEIVLLNVQSGTYHSLDAIGGVIWRALESAPTVEGVCAAMAAEYPSNPDAVRADTLAFIGKLAERGLVSVE